MYRLLFGKRRNSGLVNKQWIIARPPKPQASCQHDLRLMPTTQKDREKVIPAWSKSAMLIHEALPVIDEQDESLFHALKAIQEQGRLIFKGERGYPGQRNAEFPEDGS